MENLKMFRPDKKTKRKRQHRDWKKKSNILKQWQKEQANRKRSGLPTTRMPVDFPKKRKYGSHKRGTK